MNNAIIMKNETLASIHTQNELLMFTIINDIDKKDRNANNSEYVQYCNMLHNNKNMCESLTGMHTLVESPADEAQYCKHCLYMPIEHNSEYMHANYHTDTTCELYRRVIKVCHMDSEVLIPVAVYNKFTAISECLARNHIDHMFTVGTYEESSSYVNSDCVEVSEPFLLPHRAITKYNTVLNITLQNMPQIHIECSTTIQAMYNMYIIDLDVDDVETMVLLTSKSVFKIVNYILEHYSNNA